MKINNFKYTNAWDENSISTGWLRLGNVEFKKLTGLDKNDYPTVYLSEPIEDGDLVISLFDKDLSKSMYIVEKVSGNSYTTICLDTQEGLFVFEQGLSYEELNSDYGLVARNRDIKLSLEF